MRPDRCATWEAEHWVDRGCDACADQPAVLAACSWGGVAGAPAEPARAFLQTGDEIAAREREAGCGIGVRLVPDPEFDRVDPTCDREFVDRRLEREHAGRLAGGAHDRRDRYVESGDSL